MGLNARLVKSLLPAAEWATKRNSIARLRAGGRVAVLDPQAVLDEAERRATARLPRSWDVTSDSLAAFLAIESGAAALVLRQIEAAAGGEKPPRGSAGFGRQTFSRVAPRIPFVAWVNLRARQPSVERWF